MYVHSKYGTDRSGKPVFEAYDDNVHCREKELFKAQDHPKAVPHTPVYLGWDNTGRNPAVVVAQKSDDGQWRAQYELCAQGMGMKAFAAEVKRWLTQQIPDYRILKITCDPAGKAKGADDLDMRMLIVQAFPGVPVLNARTNDPATRIEAVDGAMRRQILPGGEPALIISKRCKILRTACINKYKYRKMKISGEERYTETPDKITPYADVADALQYLMLGGGEGRLNSGDSSKEPKWPTDGAAIQMAKPKGWNPLNVSDRG
jgi:hypothetical protein